MQYMDPIYTLWQMKRPWDRAQWSQFRLQKFNGGQSKLHLDGTLLLVKKDFQEYTHISSTLRPNSLDVNPFPASTARREVLEGTRCTTTMHIHTPLQQQQISLPSTGCSWFFVHLLLQTTSPSLLP